MPLCTINAYPPYDKQLEILEVLFKPDPDTVKQVDLCCGRGFGKTFLAVIAAARALSIDGNQAGLFLEPDWNSVNSVFLPTWRQLIPPDLYTINRGDRKITWANGSVLYYGARNITGSIDARRDKYRGLNLTFVIDDEAAKGCDEQQYLNTLAAIRKPSKVRFYFTISTPKVGAYKRLITSPPHMLFRGSSADNPYLPAGFVQNLLDNMSRIVARREVYGEFVSLEGRIWQNCKYTLTQPGEMPPEDEAWPLGNRHDSHVRYDPNKPYWLMCDLGSATGSYVAVQKAGGSRDYTKPVWVAVADYCPISDASASRAFQVFRDRFGVPAGVTAGSDVNTKSTTDGTTVSYFAQKIFGNVPIYPCNEAIYEKQVQGDNLMSLMCDGAGRRRFTIARDFIEIEPDSHRGVRQMIEEDEYPDMDRRDLTSPFPKSKDNVVQHTRDALLMGFSVLEPPMWYKGVGPA